MAESELIELAKKALSEGIGLYSIDLKPAADGFHFEVELDGLADPRGAVSLSDCESFSRRFVTVVDDALLERSDPDLFPEGMNTENYSLEVSSAGVERMVRLPDELERFRDQPLKIKLNRNGTVLSEVVRFVHTEKNGEKIKYTFQTYIPVKERRKGKKKTKDPDGKGQGEQFEVDSSDLLQANLYLDF